MTLRAWALILALTLSACSGPAPPQVPVNEQPIAPVPPETSQAAATVAPVAVDVPKPAPPIVVAEVAPARPLLTDAGLKLLIELEVGSEQMYVSRYIMPIYPGGPSGVTICIGYDIGFVTAAQFRLDWAQHAQVERLAATAGITGAAARALIPGLRDVVTPLPLCKAVFLQAMVPKYYNLARRAFGAHHFDQLPPYTRDALVLLVFNRGVAMAGKTRTEMKHIRDVCMPLLDVATEKAVDCIVAQLTIMPRVWVGSSIEDGLRKRCLRQAAHAARVYQ